MNAKGSSYLRSRGPIARKTEGTSGKISSRLVSLLLVIILILTMVPAMAFANAETTEVTGAEEVPVESTPVETEEPETGGTDGSGLEGAGVTDETASGVEGAPEEEQTQGSEETQAPDLGEEVVLLSEESEEETSEQEIVPLAAGFASFNGVDLDGASSFSITTDAADKSQVYLSVNEHFSEASATKTIEIKLANGLALYPIAVPGMSYNSESKTWSFTGVEGTPHEGVITGGSWTPAPTINGYQPGAGTLTYTLASTAKEVSVDIPVVADTMFNRYKTAQVLGSGVAGSGNDVAPIIASSYLNGTVVNTEALEEYYISPVNTYEGFRFFPTDDKQDTAGTILIAPGTQWQFGNMFGFFATGGFRSCLHQEISIVVGLPKDAGFTSAIMAPDSSVAEGMYSISAVDKTQANNDYVTITFAPEADISRARILFQGTVGPDVGTGVSFKPFLDTARSTVLRWDKTSVESLDNAGWWPTLLNAEVGENVSFDNITDSIYAQEADAPAPSRLLGYFNVKNYTVDDKTNMRFLMTYPSEVGVTSVKLMATKEAKNIVATTTGGKTIELASVNTNITGTAGAKYAFVDFAGSLAAGEYISSVAYTADEIVSGAYTDIGMGEASGAKSMNFYGKLFATSGSYQATINVIVPAVETPSYTNPSDWKIADGATGTTTMKVVKTAWPSMNIYTTNAGYDKESNPEGLLRADKTDFTTINARFGAGFYRYDDVVSSWEGFVTYVREAPGLYIDPSSIYATYNGVNYTPDSITGFIDDSGCKVYKITLDEAVMGFGWTHPGGWIEGYPPVDVYANVRATATAKNSSVKLNDVFFGHPVDAVPNTRYIAYSGNVASKSPSENYGITGDANLYTAVPTEAADHTLTLVAYAKLVVGTSADKKDNDWKVYQPDDSSTVIDLNTQEAARIKLSLVNNFDNDVAANSVFIVPVPRAGVSTGNTHINDTFNWSMYLKSISASSDYKIEYYSGSGYLTNSASASWSETMGDPTKVTTIKLTRTKALPAGSTDDIILEFTMPNSKEAIDNDWVGKVNTFNMLVEANVLGNSVETSSETIALRLNTGSIEGVVMLDVDRSGATNSGDTPVEGVVVNAYKPGTTELIQSVTTLSDGSYAFTALNDAASVDLEFVQPNFANNPMRYVPTADEDGNYRVAGVVPSAGTATKVDALLQQPWTVDFSVPVGQAPATQYVYHANKATAPQDPQVAGYVFRGWYTSNAYTTAFDFTQNITANTTVYGKFDTVYSIDYVLGSGASIADSKTNPATYTVSDLPISFNPATRDGYTFGGWSIAQKEGSTGNISYDNDTRTLGAGTAGNLVATALWTAIPYTITYNLGGGALADGASNPTGYVVGDLPITLNSPSKTGHTFTGWTVALVSGQTPAGNVTYDANAKQIQAGTFGNLTVTANYTADSFSVAYHPNDGGALAEDESQPNPQPVTYGQNFTPLANPYAKTGYDFNGWNTAKDGSGTPYTAGIAANYGHTSGVTLYAQWIPASGTKYVTEHYLVGPSGIAETTPYATIEGADYTEAEVTATAISITGYTYAEGYSSGSTVEVKTAKVAADGSLKLKLYYEINFYPVRFIDWNGTVLSNQSVSHGSAAIAPTGLARIGYSWAGWDKGFSNITGPTDVHAQYAINYYTVTFVDHNGAVLATRSVAYGGNATAPSNPTRTGFVFTGWDRGYTNITSNITVTAQYTVALHTVTFVDYNGTVLQSSTVEYGSAITPPAEPSRNGYTFTGWDQDSAVWTNVTADATVRAQYEAEPTTSTVTPGSSTTTTTTTTPTPPTTTEGGTTPGITIPGTDVPLYGQEGFWSLFNLICAILAAGALVVLSVRALTRKKTVDATTGHDKGYTRVGGSWVNEAGDIVDESEEGKRHLRSVFVVLTALAAVVAVVMFILTQDMTLKMALFDMWSVLFAVLLIAAVVMAVASFKRVRVADDEDKTEVRFSATA